MHSYSFVLNFNDPSLSAAPLTQPYINYIF